MSCYQECICTDCFLEAKTNTQCRCSLLRRKSHGVINPVNEASLKDIPGKFLLFCSRAVCLLFFPLFNTELQREIFKNFTFLENSFYYVQEQSAFFFSFNTELQREIF